LSGDALPHDTATPASRYEAGAALCEAIRSCQDAEMSHAESKDKAVTAFNDAVDTTNEDERLVLLGVANYHAAMATYELNLEIHSRLEGVLAGSAARKKKAKVNPASRDW
jgi:hypothetical protein